MAPSEQRRKKKGKDNWVLHVHWVAKKNDVPKRPD